MDSIDYLANYSQVTIEIISHMSCGVVKFDFAGVFRYDRVRDLATDRRSKLDEANTLHQFFRDIDDEEAWIK